MARNFLFEIAAIDPTTGLTQTIRMSSRSASAAGVYVDGLEWIPAILGAPTLNIELWEGQPKAATFDYGSITFELNAVFANQDWTKFAWSGSLATIWRGQDGDAFEDYRQIWSGSLGPIERTSDQEASVVLLGAEAGLQRNLLSASYAGTGNAEGPGSMLGTLKPMTLGAATNVEPVLIDANYFIYQYHGYGACPVGAIYSNALILDTARQKSTQTTYAALKALALLPGDFATAPAVGMFRLGSDPQGAKITADVGVAATVGAAISTMIQIAGVPAALIHSSVAATPRAYSLYATDQVTIYDVVAEAALMGSRYLIADATGKFYLAPHASTKIPGTLNSDRSTLPYVIPSSIKQVASADPVYRVKVGHTRVWATHSATEISPAIATLGEDLAAAEAAAEAAHDAADAAAADASFAKDRVVNQTLDGILDRTEKLNVIREFSTYTAERAKLVADGTALAVTTEVTAYSGAYTDLKNYLEALVPAYTDTSQDTIIDAAIYTARFNGYLIARLNLSNALANKAATMANWTSVAARPTNLTGLNSTEGTKLTGIAAGATKNVFTFSATAPASPANGDVWTVPANGTTPAITYNRVNGAWVQAANVVTSTNQVLDGANLGGTAIWNGVSGTGKPENNATVGAPVGTLVGGIPVADLVGAITNSSGALIPLSDILVDVDALTATYGNTASSAANAEAAEAALALALQYRDAASGSATAANTSKSSADTFAAAANTAKVAAEGAQSVTIAARDIALTARTGATDKAAEAALSASNAVVSANSANASYNSSRAQAALLFPENLDSTASTFTEIIGGDPVSVPAINTSYIVLTDSGYAFQRVGSNVLKHRQPIALVTGRVYEISADFDPVTIANGEAPKVRILLNGLDSFYASTSANAASPEVTIGTEKVTVTRRFSATATTNVTAWPIRGVWSRVGAQVYDSTNSLIRVTRFSVRDITTLVATESSANAASTSASGSAASASSAGTSATAANSAKASAETARGQAQTFRNEAATSADNAAGSAATALTQAGISTTSKNQSGASATAAAGSASMANTKATEAGQAATAAAGSATAAETSRGQASTSAGQAATSATDALGSKNAAAASATVAATQAGNAGTSASAAATSESNAATSETNAGTSASSASTARTQAETARGQAQTFASNASTSADNAAGSASTAVTQAGIATASKNQAGTSATAAAGSASTALAKATEALNSANSASGSATTAGTKANDASGSATAAAQSATGAGTSSSNAAQSASAAASSAVASAASYGQSRAQAALLFPESMDATASTFTESINGDPIAALPINPLWIVSTSTGYTFQRQGSSVLKQRQVIALIPGRVYEVSADFEPVSITSGEAPLVRILMYGLDSTYSITSSNSTSPAVAVGTASVTVTRRFAVSPSSNISPWPAVGVYARAGAQIYESTSSLIRVTRFSVRDVTTLVAAEVQAAAAATSASNAATSASNAGTSATASNTAKIAAETARGQATTSASNAATSASNANASANTATTQAGVASTARANAETAASAASGHASTASTKADQAGQSANSASASANTANTKAGQASTSAAAAALSESNAAGSFNSASTSATLAAASANDAAARASGNIVGTGNFNAGSVGQWNGNVSIVPAGINKALRSTNRNAFDGAPILVAPSRRYRVEVAGCAPGSFALHAGLQVLDANGGEVDYPNDVVQTAGVSTYVTKIFDLVTPTNTVTIRPFVLSNGPVNAAGHDVRVRSISIVDVTESFAAGGSATAAATSSSAANTAATNAGNSASSASGHANTASTKAGEAAGSASAAASSASSASGSASSASQSLSLFSSYTHGAGNLLSHTDFINSTDGWNTYSFNGANVTFVRNAAGDSYRPSNENVLSIFQVGRTGTDSGGGWYSDRVSVAAGSWVEFYAFASAHRCMVEAHIEFYNAANQIVLYVYSGRVTPGIGGRNPNGWTQLGRASVQVPAGATQAGIVLTKFDTIAGANPNDSYAWFWRPYVGAAREGQTEWNPYSRGNGSAVVTGLSASVTQQAGTLASVDGRTQAYWQVQTNVNSGSTAFIAAKSVAADGVGGSTVSLGANQIHLYNPIAAGTPDQWKKTLSISNGNAEFSGGLSAATYIRLGSGEKWNVALQQRDFSISDGTSIEFGTNLGGLPALTFATTGLAPLSTGETYSLYADSLSPTGFVARLKIITPSTPTSYNLTNATQPGSGPTWQAEKGGNPDANDGTYKITINGSVTQANTSYDPGSGGGGGGGVIP